jgi:hypothetical protein
MVNVYFTYIEDLNMKSRQLAFILAIVAGLLCIGAFVTKLIRSGETEYTILWAGIFVIALGISALYRK